jgi:hypothetical protein
MALPDLLRCRVRYFRDGLAFGSKMFVEAVFERNRDHFGTKRKTGARKIRFCLAEGLCTARFSLKDKILISTPTFRRTDNTRQAHFAINWQHAYKFELPSINYQPIFRYIVCPSVGNKILSLSLYFRFSSTAIVGGRWHMFAL